MPQIDNGGPSVADVQSYQEYSQQHEFTHESGVIVLPVASREPRHRRIRLHGGYGMRTVNWQATRQGKPPIIPSAMDTVLDKVLDTKVTADLPIPMPQTGTYLFRMRGKYTFVQQAPRVAGTNAFPTAGYPHGIDPMDTIGAEAVGDSLDQQPAIETIEDFDAAVTIVDDNVRNGAGTIFSWPFTVIPSSFAAQTIQ